MTHSIAVNQLGWIDAGHDHRRRLGYNLVSNVPTNVSTSASIVITKSLMACSTQAKARGYRELEANRDPSARSGRFGFDRMRASF
jgi:hypothetical protein